MGESESILQSLYVVGGISGIAMLYYGIGLLIEGSALVASLPFIGFGLGLISAACYLKFLISRNNRGGGNTEEQQQFEEKFKNVLNKSPKSITTQELEGFTKMLEQEKTNMNSSRVNEDILKAEEIKSKLDEGRDFKNFTPKNIKELSKPLEKQIHLNASTSNTDAKMSSVINDGERLENEHQKKINDSRIAAPSQIENKTDSVINQAQGTQPQRNI
jgi:hypothetical protein